MYAPPLTLITIPKCVLMLLWENSSRLFQSQNLKKKKKIFPMTAWYVVCWGGGSTVDIKTHLIHFSDFWSKDKYEKL